MATQRRVAMPPGGPGLTAIRAQELNQWQKVVKGAPHITGVQPISPLYRQQVVAAAEQAGR